MSPLPSSIHQKGPLEIDFEIAKEGDDWVLRAKGSGNVLGRHKSKADAQAQERAIQANKRFKITVDDMRKLCEPCAEKMVANGVKHFYLDSQVKNFGLSDEALSGLCKRFGDAEGFRSACMESSLSGEMDNIGSFCNWLKEECHGSVESSEKTPVREHAVNETHNIKGVEIFSAGEWNGDKYTEKDIDSIVNAFEETKNALKPYIKLGHSEDQQLLAADSLPAAGWIENIYRKGKMLFADFIDMPRKVADLVRARAYKRVSSEIFVNIKVNGKRYPLALKAVALLGGETPAVQNLNDVHALYALDAGVLAYSKEAEVRAYESDSAIILKETNMPEDVKQFLGTPSPAQIAVSRGQADSVAGSKENAMPQPAPQGDECYQQLAQMKLELDKYKQHQDSMMPRYTAMESEIISLKSNLESVTKERNESNKKFAEASIELKKISDEKNASEIKATVSKFVQEKKILPSQAGALEALMLHAKESVVKKFKVGDKEIDSAEALLLEFIGAAASVGLSTEPKSESGKSTAIVNPNDGDAMDKAVRDYMAKNDEKSYTKAYTAVAKSAHESVKTVAEENGKVKA